MQTTHPQLNAFNRGEVSPLTIADERVRDKGALRVENFSIMPQGGLQRRPGTQTILRNVKPACLLFIFKDGILNFPCDGGGPDANVGKDPSVLVTCKSLTGTATLCGFSGYSSDAAPYNPADPAAWEGQYRKWKSRKLTGYREEASAQCSDCPDYYGGPGVSPGIWRFEFSGEAEVDCAGNVSYGSRKNTAFRGDCQYDYDYTDGTTTVVPSSGMYVVTDCGLIPIDSQGVAVASTLTSRTVTGCGCGTYSGPTFTRRIDGVASETLDEERYLYDALAELAAGGSPDVVEGDSCCASTDASDLTYPEDTNPIEITGTAVILTITATGVSNGTSIIKLTFSNTLNGDPLPNTEELIEVQLNETGDAVIEYTIPQPPLLGTRCLIDYSIQPQL